MRAVGNTRWVRSVLLVLVAACGGGDDSFGTPGGSDAPPRVDAPTGDGATDACIPREFPRYTTANEFELIRP